MNSIYLFKDTGKQVFLGETITYTKTYNKEFYTKKETITATLTPESVKELIKLNIIVEKDPTEKYDLIVKEYIKEISKTIGIDEDTLKDVRKYYPAALFSMLLKTMSSKYSIKDYNECALVSSLSGKVFPIENDLVDKSKDKVAVFPSLKTAFEAVETLKKSSWFCGYFDDDEQEN